MFSPADAKSLVGSFFASPVSRGKILLTWTLNTPEWMTLRIERAIDGGKPEPLAKLDRAEQYLDAAAPTGSLSRHTVYYLSVDGIDVAPLVAAAGDTVRDPEAAKLTADQGILLRKRGWPAALFAVKSSGLRCSCYDPVRNQIKHDNCEKCSGTGYIVGYADPVIIHMLGETQENRSTTVTEAGELEQSDRHLWTNAEVRLRERDVLVTASWKRYRIESVRQNSRNESPTRQIARCLELNPSDVEFDLQVPNALQDVLRRQPNRTRQF